MAWQPSKYRRQYSVRVKSGVRLAVMFDKQAGSITRFATQLQYFDGVDASWRTFAQIDHEPSNPMGHDLYAEGLHVDIYYRDGTKETVQPAQPSHLNKPVGVLLRASTEYLKAHEEYFDQVARRQISLSSPPQYP